VIIPSQGRYIHTGQHKHRINAHANIHALSGIRTHGPSVRTNEELHVLDRAATVIGKRGSHTHVNIPGGIHTIYITS
jgi:hypothetical protein